MSTFATKVIHRPTGVVSWALMIDDYFGHHKYGVAVPNKSWPIPDQREIMMGSFDLAQDDAFVFRVDEFTEDFEYAFTDKD